MNRDKSWRAYCQIVRLTLDAQELGSRQRMNSNAYLEPKRESHPTFRNPTAAQKHMHCTKNGVVARRSQKTACFAIQDEDLIKMPQDKTFTPCQLLFELQVVAERSFTSAYIQTSLLWALIPTRNLNKQSKEPGTVFKHWVQKATHLSWLYWAILSLPL